MKTKKWAIKSLLVLVVFLLLGLILKSFFNWRDNYQGKIYPGVKIGSLDLSGKSAAEAQELINEKTSNIINSGLIFSYNHKSTTIDASVSSFDADLSYPALTFDVDNTVKQALALSQNMNYFNYLLFRLEPQNKKIIKPIYTLDEERIKPLLANAFPELNIAPINASFTLSEKTGELVTDPEELGKEINYDLAFSEIKNNLDSLNNLPVDLKTHSKYPEVKAGDLTSLEGEAKKIINDESLKLEYKDPNQDIATTTWKIRPEKLITWLSINKDNGSLKLSLDQTKIISYLSLNASPKIDVEAVRPRFEISNGKVINWQTGTKGHQLDIPSSAAKISEAFLSGQKDINLVVKDVVDDTFVSEDNLNIKEIIGTGHSNFKGSSADRIKNIKAGAKAVDGMLIAPGEEFSLVKALGNVDAENGYYPELVIKGDKTVKEYGGGLCQIGTTLFRSALYSGLPITYRQNHSYRVSYYEPAGMDAAVYIPQPDVRFINDTANYILIQSRFSGNDIYFDFWGTKDGREVTITDPTVYNIVKPKPTKYIETPELAPGKEKCTESAHNGADAYFDYKVVYPSTATTTPVHERRFSSHYVPWQKVCLIGANTASSTSVIGTTGSSTTTTSKTN
jgi:vancomycin resistance protein YoaR